MTAQGPIGDSSLRVVSAVPGRIRLRAGRSGAAELGAMADELGSWPQIAAVDLRPRSGSLVVRFDPLHAATVADGLLDLGVDVRAGVRLPVPTHPASAVATAAAAGNAAVARRLGGTDLRVLVPLGLGLMAARRAMRGEERLADAPWYVLAWYASETYAKFHSGVAGAAGQLADSEEE